MSLSVGSLRYWQLKRSRRADRAQRPCAGGSAGKQDARARLAMFGWFFGQSISLRVGWSVGWISCGPAAQMPRSQLQSANCIHGRSPVVTVAARVLSAFQSICQLHPDARCQTPSTGSFRLPSTGGSFAGRVGWHRRHRPLSVASSPHRRRRHTAVVVATPASEFAAPQCTARARVGGP